MPDLTQEEARRNVYLDATMSTPEDVDALIAAVRRDTLAQVRGVVEGIGPCAIDAARYPKLVGLDLCYRADILERLDQLEG